MGIGVGIIGYGKQGASHVRRLSEHPGYDVIAVADATEASRLQAIADFPHLRIYEKVETLLNDADIDLVVVVTPTTTHAPLSILSLRAGKHVVCEKPMCMNGHEAEQIRDAADDSGTFFNVYQNRRGDAYFTRAKDVLSSGRIGALRDMRIVRSRWGIGAMVWGSDRFRPVWRSERSYGGGMLYDWGGHWIDQALLLHRKAVTSVFAELFISGFVSGQDADDGFRLLLKFEDGVSAHIEFQAASMGQLDTGGWILSGTGGGYVPGTVYELVDPTEPLTSEVSTSPWEADPAPFDFWTQLSSAIEKNDKSLLPVPIGESLRVMRIIDAAFQSHDRGEVVKFTQPI